MATVVFTLCGYPAFTGGAFCWLLSIPIRHLEHLNQVVNPSRLCSEVAGSIEVLTRLLRASTNGMQRLAGAPIPWE